MSSWLASFSLPNPFKPDSNSDSDADDDDPELSSTNQDVSPNSGISQTISHRLRDVASFFDSTSLAQLTDDQTANREAPGTPSASDTFTGIKNDFVEIGGSIKALLSSSSNKAATGISSFASNFLKFDDDEGVTEEADYEEEEDDDALEIDEEVVAFAQKVSMRPELWTDFPLALDDDFDMSESQRLHAATVVHLVPSLASLRQEICGHLSSGKFWLIYFILLLPRLNEDDVKLLCSPKIVEAREKLLQKLHNNSNAQEGTSDAEAAAISEIGLGGESSLKPKDITSEALITTPEFQEVKSGVNVVDDQGESSHNQKQCDSMEDVSFSDLEDEDGDLSDRLSGLRLSQSARISSASESNEWIRLKESARAHSGRAKTGSSNIHGSGKDSESEESGGWLAVDDAEIDSLGSV